MSASSLRLLPPNTDSQEIWLRKLSRGVALVLIESNVVNITFVSDNIEQNGGFELQVFPFYRIVSDNVLILCFSKFKPQIYKVFAGDSYEHRSRSGDETARAATRWRNRCQLVSSTELLTRRERTYQQLLRSLVSDRQRQ